MIPWVEDYNRRLATSIWLGVTTARQRKEETSPAKATNERQALEAARRLYPRIVPGVFVAAYDEELRRV